MTIPASIATSATADGTPALDISAVPINTALAAVAFVHGSTVSFRYAKGKSGRNIETRRLEVESINQSKDGALSIVGYDPDRGDVRAYRLDRIKGTLSFED